MTLHSSSILRRELRPTDANHQSWSHDYRQPAFNTTGNAAPRFDDLSKSNRVNLLRHPTGSSLYSSPTSSAMYDWREAQAATNQSSAAGSLFNQALHEPRQARRYQLYAATLLESSYQELVALFTQVIDDIFPVNRCRDEPLTRVAVQCATGAAALALLDTRSVVFEAIAQLCRRNVHFSSAPPQFRFARSSVPPSLRESTRFFSTTARGMTSPRRSYDDPSNIVLLNALEYFFLRFAASAFEPGVVSIGAVNHQTVYWALLEDYLLLCERLLFGHSLSIPPSVHLNANCAPRTPSEQLRSPPSNNSAQSANSVPESLSELGVGAPDSIVKIMLYSWADSVEEQSSHAASSVDRATTMLLNRVHTGSRYTSHSSGISVVLCLRHLLKFTLRWSIFAEVSLNRHFASNDYFGSGAVLTSTRYGASRATTSLCHTSLVVVYRFLRHAILQWPSKNLRGVVELWLTALQPWRYDPLIGTTDAARNEQTSSMRPDDQKSQEYLAKNRPFFTKLLHLFVDRLLNHDSLSDTDMIACLERIVGVYHANGLIEAIRQETTGGSFSGYGVNASVFSADRRDSDSPLSQRRPSRADSVATASSVRSESARRLAYPDEDWLAGLSDMDNVYKIEQLRYAIGASRDYWSYQIELRQQEDTVRSTWRNWMQSQLWGTRHWNDLLPEGPYRLYTADELDRLRQRLQAIDATLAQLFPELADGSSESHSHANGSASAHLGRSRSRANGGDEQTVAIARAALVNSANAGLLDRSVNLITSFGVDAERRWRAEAQHGIPPEYAPRSRREVPLCAHLFQRVADSINKSHPGTIASLWERTDAISWLVRPMLEGPVDASRENRLAEPYRRFYPARLNFRRFARAEFSIALLFSAGVKYMFGFGVKDFILLFGFFSTLLYLLLIAEVLLPQPQEDPRFQQCFGAARRGRMGSAANSCFVTHSAMPDGDAVRRRRSTSMPVWRLSQGGSR